jgi:nickel transport protein
MNPLRLLRATTAAAAVPTSFALIALLQAEPARSHAIESTLERLSALNASLRDAGSTAEPAAQLLLQSRFGNGEPAADASVRLIRPGGVALEIGRTDSAGSLRFNLPREAGDAWEVQVDAGPGHRDYLELPHTQSVSQSRPAAMLTVQARSTDSHSRLWLGLGAGLCAAGMLVRRQRRT